MAGIETWMAGWAGPAMGFLLNLFSPDSRGECPRMPQPMQEAVNSPSIDQVLKEWVESIKERLAQVAESMPNWFYAYSLFVMTLLGYLLYETFNRFRGMKWCQNNPVPHLINLLPVVENLKNVFVRSDLLSFRYLSKEQCAIREGCRELVLTDAVLKEVMGKLRGEIEKGLNPATKGNSSVKCFNTYVQKFPTGKEKGKFLALDLGGTNFRVILIELNGRHFDMKSKIYEISQDKMSGHGDQLFRYIAECLHEFAHENHVEKDNLPLGFTFSFPLLQVGLSKGILQKWTKGFNCDGVVGEDVVSKVKQAIDSCGGLKINVAAILNDTTGTLMSCAWKNKNCKIGVILGTGTNACYVEKIQNVIGFDGDQSIPHVIINTEWGAFGDNGELNFIRTEYDIEVDKNSINPGRQLLEKLISGMYLGEIVRLLIVRFVREHLLFDGQLFPEIETKQSFKTEYVSFIERDVKGTFKECRRVLKKFGYTDVSDEDCNSVRYICECVSRRAAHLASAGLATLINKMGYPSLTIGVDGTLYRLHPHFHDLMVKKISQLVNNQINEFGLMLSSDGSGRGAVIVAASLS